MTLKNLYILVLTLLFLSGGYGVIQAQTPAPPPPKHIVQPGETLFRIALKYNTTVEQLVALNNLVDPSRIFVGQSLILPSNVTPATPTPIPPTAIPPTLAPPTATAPPPTATSIVTPAVPPTPLPLPTSNAVSTPEVYKTHVVQPGEWLTTIAKQYGVEWTEIVRLNAIADPNRIAVGTVLKIPNGGIPGTVQAIPGPAGVALPPPNLNDIAGVSGKWIKVVLSEQRVYAYENGKLLKSVVVSTGLPGTPTVIGDFNVYLKYSSQLMYGPDYYLPGVPYVMYFYQGYGLHGTYWHSNFGTPMSHGCVNLPTPEAKWLWEWAPVGTRVSVVW